MSRFANDRVAGHEDEARVLSAMWAEVCELLGGRVDRILEDEFEVERAGHRFVVNWVTTGMPCVRSVVDGQRVFTGEAFAFRRELRATKAGE